MRWFLLALCCLFVAPIYGQGRWPDGTRGPWVVLVKPTTTFRINDSAIRADDHLQFTMQPNRRYAVRVMVFWVSTGNPDFHFNFSCPLDQEGQTSSVTRWFVPTGASQLSKNHEACGADTGLVWTGTGVEGAYVQIDSVIRSNASQATTASFDWAQRVAHADSTAVLAGSYLEYAEINP